MKRILLSLAAVAVLASCVKENNLASLAGQETISAVSSDSKTLLDGNAVVWETTDKIAVVVNGETQVKTAEFAVVEETVNGSEADFVGNTGADWSKATFAYAVYPAASVNLTHNLPAEQNGDVSGLMLSTAVVPVDDMKNGSASVEFNPALSLLNVIVPAGVKSVELTSAGSALVGEALYEIESDYKAVISGFNKEVKTVTLTVAEAGTYPVIVYPGTVGDFTIKLVGTNDETFEKTVPDITLVAAEARAVNLMQIFEFAPEEAIEVAANGGTIELPFTTTVEEITVTEDADWLKSAVAVKGFQTGNVTLVATANEGEEARTAVVTVSWGEGKSVSFTLTQPAIYRGFLNDENGDPIQWEETFGLYTSESDANAANVANATATHKNVFTIALSDDYTKGTYLVDNIFKATSYFHNSQPVSNKGGKFYANYKDGKLTLLYANSVNCYGFTSDVTISYDETAKTFSAAPFQAYDYSSYKYRYIGGYAAVVKVEEPEVGADPIAGEWDVTVQFAPASGGDYAEKTGTMVISGSNGSYVIETIAGETFNLTATFANNTLTASKNGATLTLTYDAAVGTLTQDSKEFQTWELPTMKSLVATKQGGATPEVPGGNNELDKFVGTWSETYVNKPYSWSAETIYENEFTVSVVDGKLYFEGMFLFKMSSTEYRSNYYGTPSADGTTVTLEDSNSPHGYFGPMAYAGGPIVLTVDGNSLTVASAYNGQVANYVATKQGAVEPEPEVPADPWASDAVVTYDLPADAGDSRQVLRQIKYFADAENVNIRLVASISKILEKTDGLTISFYDKTNGTAGDGFYGWWNNAIGDVEYNAERCGLISGSSIEMTVAGNAVDVQTVEDGDLVTWTFAFPRSANAVLANDVVYMGVLTLDSAWNATGAMPDKYANMLEVTLP